MMSEEYTVVIGGLLMGLNVIDYSISLPGEEFDKSVSSCFHSHSVHESFHSQPGVLNLSLFLRDGNYLAKASEAEEAIEE